MTGRGNDDVETGGDRGGVDAGGDWAGGVGLDDGGGGGCGGADGGGVVGVFRIGRGDWAPGVSGLDGDLRGAVDFSATEFSGVGNSHARSRNQSRIRESSG